MTLLQKLWRNKNTLIIFLTPLVLLPLAIPESKVARCGFGLLLMAIYWITEALPLSVTALLPMILFPMLGVARAKELAMHYMKDAIFLFMGGLGVAISVENWNLHKRVALRVLLLMGSKVRWVMLGLMLTTAFLSMWISNTAATAMMTPIANAVFYQIWKIQQKLDIKMKRLDKEKTDDKKEENRIETKDSKDGSMESADDDDHNIDYERLDPKSRNLGLALTLCICYASTCGGMSTLTGTGPNIIMKGLADELSNGTSKVTFSSWMMFGVPIAFINLILCWIWLQIHFFGIRTFFGCTKLDTEKSMEAIKAMFQREYRKLGPTRFAEKAVIGHFTVLVLLWLTFDSEFFPGWGTFFKKGYTSNAGASLLVFGAMFIFPSENPFARTQQYTFAGDVSKEKSETDPESDTKAERMARGKSVEKLLSWNVVQNHLPWGLILLVGGGYALAEACKLSGLSPWVGEQLTVLEGLPTPVITLLLSLIISFVTEMTSNSATSAIVLPIIVEMSKNLGINPLYFIAPTTIACSFAFMLPVATPPNAIAFSYGLVKVVDMAKAGIVLNMISVVLVTMAINLWGMSIFSLHTMPEWALTLTTQGVLTNITTNGTLYSHV